MNAPFENRKAREPQANHSEPFQTASGSPRSKEEWSTGEKNKDRDVTL